MGTRDAPAEGRQGSEARSQAAMRLTVRAIFNLSGGCCVHHAAEATKSRSIDCIFGIMPIPSDTSLNEEEITMEGVLDAVVFSQPENDFLVGRLAVLGRREPVTIVGLLPEPHPGETLILKGKWEFDPRFGEQFRFVDAQVKAPSTVRGIEKYLSSKLVPGIGPEMARRITAMFGEETLQVIETKPEDLRKVPGIGKQRAERISKAFQEHKGIRDVMLFLQSHGISTGYAFKIFRKYGSQSPRIISQNPYILVTDIRGIGFKSADKVARSLGMDMKSPLRAGAGILHVLETAQAEGHVFYPQSVVLEKARQLLEINARIIEDALVQLAQGGRIAIEDERVYAAGMAAAENAVAAKINRLLTSPRLLPSIKIDLAIQWIEGRINIGLSDAQRLALAEAIRQKMLIITGGPGTGKTTLLRSLTQILEAKNIRVLLCAPTGRAAKRLTAASGKEARTIHRLLEYSPGAGGFLRNSQRPLDADYVIIDEASMVDLRLMNHLLDALSPQATLLLVGDADQLPSVGPGNVLGDLIRSGKVPVVKLSAIFRQASRSQIVTNAHLINQGKMPVISAPGSGESDFYLIEREDPNDALRAIKEMVSRRIPDRFGFSGPDDIQVLSPMHKGILGTENLNQELQGLLNPAGEPVRGNRFRVGDRVMQLRNNYDKDVYNGDIGRIASYDAEWGELAVSFDDCTATYHVSELDELSLAYAVSIHKSQGSEYPAVIIPLSTQHYVLLRRNLLYTAITRARELAVVIASRRALEIAVGNGTVEERYSWLAEKV